MKKHFLIVLLVAMLLLTGCSEHYLDYDRSHSTQMPDDFIYQIGGEIRIQDDINKVTWVSVEIKNVIILKENPGPVQGITPAIAPQAIAQVNYVIDKTDSDRLFGGGDFKFFDAEGNPCPVIRSEDLPCQDRYTQYEKEYIAVPVKGDHIEIQIPLSVGDNEEEHRSAVIYGYYGVGDVEIDPTINNNLTVALIFLALGITLSVIIIIVLMNKQKKLRQELNDLKLHYPPAPDTPAEPVPEKPKALPLPGLPAGDAVERSDDP